MTIQELPAEERVSEESSMRQVIQKHYPDLSKRLQQLARYLLENPERIVLCTVAELSKDAGVPPSTVIRFANALGFNGFSEMRKEFRAQLHYTGSYRERVQSSGQVETQPSAILSQVVDASSSALKALEQSINGQDLIRAASLIQQADTVYVMGIRRAQPIATYLAYGLWQLDQRCVLLGGKGGLHKEEASGIRRTDLVFLTSFFPYSDETLWMQERAKARGARLITLTDNEISPFGEKADIAFYTKDAEVAGIRGLSTSMSLIQSLILTLAQKQ